jgi:GrpB-like predicted nucleotidyltransferase (UPF0157 family)
MKIEKIIEPNAEIQELQDSLVAEFTTLLPNSHIELVGAMAVPMTGRPELDIMVLSPDILGDSKILEATGYVQGPVVKNTSFLKKEINGIEIGVQIMSPDNHMIEVHRKIISKLREDETLRKRYEEFKRTLAGLTRPEYKEKKSAWIKENLL